ncbi:peptidase [Lactobacillus crispatus]|uniref:peptidase n=1 Tax=Lactobacillus crispatus TaxID=47770 RepID=UPI0018AB9913|nr:peptidase [Lactobacillus crispatus]
MHKNNSTKQWLRKRKLDVFFLYLEGIYVTVLAFSLVLDYPLFVLEFKIGIIFTLFLMLSDAIRNKFKGNKKSGQ